LFLTFRFYTFETNRKKTGIFNFADINTTQISFNMNRLLLILPILALMMMESCNQDPDAVRFDFKKTQKYSMTEMNYEKEKFSVPSPYMMVYADSAIIIYSEKNTYALTLFDLKNNSIFEFGKIGKGPEELAMPSLLSINPSNNQCFDVFDFVKKKIFTYNVDSCRAKQAESNPVKSMGIIMASVKSLALTDSTVLNIGLFDDEYAFLISNSRKDTLSQFGNYDFNPEDQNPAMNKALAYQGRYAVRNKKIVQACNDAPIVRIFSSEDSRNFTMEKSTVLGSVDYKCLSDGSVAISSYNKTGYCDISTSSDKIYLLYSGKKSADYTKSPYDIEKCSEIHVLDWEGNFLEKMVLDTEVVNISFSESDQKIYAITNNPDPRIVYFYVGKQ